MAVRRRVKNEWRRSKPKPSEIAAAQKLAKKVDPKLLELVEAKPKNAA